MDIANTVVILNFTPSPGVPSQKGNERASKQAVVKPYTWKEVPFRAGGPLQIISPEHAAATKPCMLVSFAGEFAANVYQSDDLLLD